MSDDNKNFPSLKYLLGIFAAGVGSVLASSIVKYQSIQNKINKNEKLTKEEREFLKKVNAIRFGLADTKKLMDWEDDEY